MSAIIGTPAPSYERHMPVAQAIRAETRGPFALTTLGVASLASALPVGGSKPLLGPGKPLALLAYLASSPGYTTSRDHLVDLFWADLDPDGARHALRQTLWYLKQRLGDDGLVADAYRVTLHAAIQSDRESFLRAVQKQQFEQAVEIYRGDFLPGFALPGAADFEQWADVERYRLRRLFERRRGAPVWREYKPCTWTIPLATSPTVQASVRCQDHWLPSDERVRLQCLA